MAIGINTQHRRGEDIRMGSNTNGGVIKCGGWLIDLGPEGGDKGGYLVYQGVPEGIFSAKNSYTATYLEPKLHRNREIPVP